MLLAVQAQTTSSRRGTKAGPEPPPRRWSRSSRLVYPSPSWRSRATRLLMNCSRSFSSRSSRLPALVRSILGDPGLAAEAARLAALADGAIGWQAALKTEPKSQCGSRCSAGSPWACATRLSTRFRTAGGCSSCGSAAMSCSAPPRSPDEAIWIASIASVESSWAQRDDRNGDNGNVGSAPIGIASDDRIARSGEPCGAPVFALLADWGPACRRRRSMIELAGMRWSRGGSSGDGDTHRL